MTSLIGEQLADALRELEQPAPAVADAVEAVRYLGDVQRLELHEGDVLVVKAQGRLSQQAKVDLMKTMKAVIGDRAGVRVLLLEDGMDLGVIAR